MRKKNSLFSKFYIAICFAFFYLPILVTMVFSFNSSKSLSKFTGFSLRWYKALLENSEIMSAVYVSVTIAILATIASTVLGTMTAIGLSKSRKIIKDMVLSMNDIPILNPDIVTAIGWMLLFSSLGFQKGYMTMLLAHCLLYAVCHYQCVSEGEKPGPESGQCGHGPWCHTVSGTDESYSSDDPTGHICRCAAGFYYVF